MSGDDRSAVVVHDRSVGHSQEPTDQTARLSVLLISKPSAATADSFQFGRVETVVQIGASR